MLFQIELAKVGRDSKSERVEKRVFWRMLWELLEVKVIGFVTGRVT